MKIRIEGLIPLSISAFKKDKLNVHYAGKSVGKITKFIVEESGITAEAEITNKKLISKLMNQNRNKLGEK